MLSKRRKVDEEFRAFKEEWENNFFFVNHHGRPTCLICNVSIAVNKEYNIKRHYETKHKSFSELVGQARKDKLDRLKKGLKKQSDAFHKILTKQENNTLASYKVAQIIAKDKRAFIDGEFAKKCMMAVVETICPEKKEAFLNVSLSARTVTRRIEEMSENLKASQEDCFKKLQFFSIAIDESTDATDTAQLAVFVRGVSEDFTVLEEFVQLIPMKNTTTGADILKELLQCLQAKNLNLARLVSITTDGAPSMVGKHKGVVSLLQKHMQINGIDNSIVKLQCLIHQEALCAKVASFKDVMSMVVKTVNLILSRGLNHRQFRQLLLEAESQYGDLLYFCNVRWLSRGDMLLRVYQLKEEIVTFLEQKKLNASEFRDQNWICNLAFLVDVTSHLNKLNLQLQGKCQLIHDMWGHIRSFTTKLRLWESQLQSGNYAHFSTLQQHHPTCSDQFVSVIQQLRTEFLSRFDDIRSIENDIKLFSTPFDVPVEVVHEQYQMELVELQCCDELKSKFHAKGVLLLDFYKHHLKCEKYPYLINHAKKITSMFGSTYVCEQLFSSMKNTKSKLRTRLNDGHLQDVMLLASSNLKPNIDKLADQKQHQASHRWLDNGRFDNK